MKQKYLSTMSELKSSSKWQESNYIPQKTKLSSTRQLNTILLIGWLLLFSGINPSIAQNYGLRDDGGVNLPTVTYWYTGQATDLTQYGTEFAAETPGEVSVFSIEGAVIKIWKSDGGDVTGAQFNYKVWADGDTEPVDYTTVDLGWTSNDLSKATTLQTWANFGTPIDLAEGLAAGIYNVKILFSISGSGTAGTTENGPHSLQFTTPALSSAAEITAFTLPEQTGDATINSSEATISIEVLNGTDVTNLIPTIAISAGATISPESGVAQNFTAPVTYTVTAENTSVSKIWTVTVTEAAPPAANYGLRDDGGVNLPTVTYWYTGQAADLTQYGTEFAAETPGEVSVFSIKGAAIKTWKNDGGDVTGAQFNYKVWADGDTEPVDYTTIDVGWTSNDATKETSLQTWADFGAPIDLAEGLAAGTYNVKILFSISGTGTAGTTENGPHSLQFTIPALSSAAEITAFTLPEQTGDATINSSEATISIEVLNGTDVTNLIPTIAISAGATISPESGVAQNFTAPVTYTVTAENTSVSKIWTVTVTEAAPPAANFGLRDDGGVNLPTVTYWYTGQATDLTQYGTEFTAETPGEVSVFSIKGAAIKTWKNDGGDVTGAQFNYKVWADGDTEPVDYTTIDVGWTSNDATKETSLQTWADFGAPIDLADGLAAGTYNVKILFSISGAGTAGTTEDGPHSLQFTIPALSSAAEITAFTLPEQTGDATINSSEATVNIEVENGTDITNLTPTIAVSAGATISPESEVTQDFTDPISYIVTAENTSVSKIWTVTVTEAAPPTPNYGLRDDGGVNLPTVTYWYTGQAADLTQYGTEFAAETPGEVSVFSIKGSTIKTWKNGEGDVTGAQFNYKVWADSDSEPVAYNTIAVNWTSNDGDGNQTWADFGAPIDLANGLAAGTYNVKILFSISGAGTAGTTEDGPHSLQFTIPALSSAAEITAFTLPEQTGDATINSSEATISIEVENGTYLTDLTPTIAVSAGATISPESEVAQDFTDPVTYTVTAENTSVSKVWTVTVTEAAPPTPNYGLRDDGGVNLPTVTYWYTGQAADLTHYGTEFAAETPGEVSVFSIKGSTIKTWKNGEGDVTGAQFNYKVWLEGDAEPVDYTTIAVNWTSNDGDGNQTWADFGAPIDLANGLAAGTYNVKILFSISGSGTAGTTEDGPFETSFTKAGASGDLLIMDTWVTYTRNGSQTTLTGSNFDNLNLGTFHPDIPFVIKGGGIKTQNDGYNEFVSATMYYRVYKTNEAPGDFSEIDLPFAEDLPEAGQQVWESLVESISVTEGFDSNDPYSIEIYFEATYETPGGSELGTITEDNNGENYTAQFTFSTALSLNGFNAPQISLYPNPSNAYTTISWTTDLPVNNINIKNIAGQTIEIIIPTSTNQQINLSNYSSGIYIIELFTENTMTIKRLIIK